MLADATLLPCLLLSHAASSQESEDLLRYILVNAHIDSNSAKYETFTDAPELHGSQK